MNNEEQAIVVLERTRDELLNELIRSGANGGTGRAGVLAPQLVNVMQAINLINGYAPVLIKLGDSTESTPTRGPGRPPKQ